MSREKRLENALYNKVLSVKRSIETGNVVPDDSLTTKVVLACGLIEMTCYPHRPKVIRFSLVDSEYFWDDEDLNGFNNAIDDMQLNRDDVEFNMPSTRTCMDILRAIYLKKPLGKEWENSLDNAFENGFLPSAMWNLIWDCHQEGWINFPYIEKYYNLFR